MVESFSQRLLSPSTTTPLMVLLSSFSEVEVVEFFSQRLLSPSTTTPLMVLLSSFSDVEVVESFSQRLLPPPSTTLLQTPNRPRRLRSKRRPSVLEAPFSTEVLWLKELEEAHSVSSGWNSQTLRKTMVEMKRRPSRSSSSSMTAVVAAVSFASSSSSLTAVVAAVSFASSSSSLTAVVGAVSFASSSVSLAPALLFVATPWESDALSSRLMILDFFAILVLFFSTSLSKFRQTFRQNSETT